MEDNCSIKGRNGLTIKVKNLKSLQGLTGGPNIILGLFDLIEDRKSLLSGDEEHDVPFVKDIEVLQAAIKYIVAADDCKNLIQLVRHLLDTLDEKKRSGNSKEPVTALKIVINPLATGFNVAIHEDEKGE